MEQVINPYMHYLIVTIGCVVWWLLRQKDAKQELDIKLLWEKHEEDAKALQDLRLQIAEGHYKKTELDARFDKLEATFSKGFSNLGAKLDALSSSLATRSDDKRG